MSIQTLDATTIATAGASAPVKRTAAVTSVVGNVNLVAAVAGKKIRLLAAVGHVFAAVGIRSAVGGANLVALSAGADEPVVLPFNEFGWAETVAGEALVMNSAGVTTDLSVLYAEV